MFNITCGYLKAATVYIYISCLTNGKKNNGKYHENDTCQKVLCHVSITPLKISCNYYFRNIQWVLFHTWDGPSWQTEYS